jgi:hypothetical protein
MCIKVTPKPHDIKNNIAKKNTIYNILQNTISRQLLLVPVYYIEY